VTFASLPAAIVVGVLGLTAPAAGALPVTGYRCWYRDNEGNGYVDLYDRKGNYRNTG
jgi:hypothetical protein